MAENAQSNRIANTGPSPYLRIAGTSPPTGAHLTWFTTLSQAIQGSNGTGNVYGVCNNAQTQIGVWKAIGNLVFLGIVLPTAGAHSITLPGTASYNGPMLFSDGQAIWPVDNKITITTTTTTISGWLTYWG